MPGHSAQNSLERQDFRDEIHPSQSPSHGGFTGFLVRRLKGGKSTDLFNDIVSPETYWSLDHSCF